MDLHGQALDQANQVVEEFINKSYENGISKLIIVTGKGLHSKNEIDPQIDRTLEITYGLRNFIGNAVKYSNSLVEIILESDSKFTLVKVCDDGPGFSVDILDRLGEPYIRSSNKENSIKAVKIGTVACSMDNEPAPKANEA